MHRCGKGVAIVRIPGCVSCACLWGKGLDMKKNIDHSSITTHLHTVIPDTRALLLNKLGVLILQIQLLVYPPFPQRLSLLTLIRN